jgi:hypothetical protein
VGQVFDDPINFETIRESLDNIKIVLTDDLRNPNIVKHRGVIQGEQSWCQLNQEFRLVSSHPILA